MSNYHLHRHIHRPTAAHNLYDLICGQMFRVKELSQGNMSIMFLERKIHLTAGHIITSLRLKSLKSKVT